MKLTSGHTLGATKQRHRDVCTH